MALLQQTLNPFAGLGNLQKGVNGAVVTLGRKVHPYDFWLKLLNLNLSVCCFLVSLAIIETYNTFFVHFKNGSSICDAGIGFKSVFLVSRNPHIFSNGYQIKFREDPSPECGIGYIVPEWVEENPSISDIAKIYSSFKSLPTTTFILPLKSDKIDAVKKELSNTHPEVLLFLSKIRQISVREVNDDLNATSLSQISISSEADALTTKDIGAESYTLHLSADEDERDGQHCSYYIWKQHFPVKPECYVQKREGIDQWVVMLAFPHGQVEQGADITWCLCILAN